MYTPTFQAGVDFNVPEWFSVCFSYTSPCTLSPKQWLQQISRVRGTKELRVSFGKSCPHKRTPVISIAGLKDLFKKQKHFLDALYLWYDKKVPMEYVRTPLPAFQHLMIQEICSNQTFYKYPEESYRHFLRESGWEIKELSPEAPEKLVQLKVIKEKIGFFDIPTLRFISTLTY